MGYRMDFYEYWEIELIIKVFDLSDKLVQVKLFGSGFLANPHYHVICTKSLYFINYSLPQSYLK